MALVYFMWPCWWGSHVLWYVYLFSAFFNLIWFSFFVSLFLLCLTKSRLDISLFPCCGQWRAERRGWTGRGTREPTVHWKGVVAFVTSSSAFVRKLPLLERYSAETQNALCRVFSKTLHFQLSVRHNRLQQVSADVACSCMGHNLLLWDTIYLYETPSRCKLLQHSHAAFQPRIVEACYF